MKRPSRALLLLGALSASISVAHAGGRAANEVFPSIALIADPASVKPLPVSTTAARSVPSAAPAVAAEEPRRGARRARRSRFAQAHGPRERGDFVRSARVTPAPVSTTVAVPPPSSETSVPTSQAAASSPAAAAPSPAPAAPSVVSVPTAQPASERTVVERAAPGPGASVADAGGPREAPAPTLAELVARHARENGVPFALAQAVVRIESRGNARAAHGGALGLMQIKPGTARAAGFTGGARGLFDPETNLRYGMRVLGAAYKTAGGDVCRALMQYQSGHLATRMSRANQVYCSKARAIMAGA